jgi:acetylglutamate kinase
MRRFTGQTFVIKYGGHAMGDAELADNFARDVVLMKQVGINPVVVHGGGPQIGAMLDRLKIKSSFIDGLRVTDAETVEIVEMVLSGSINKAVVTAINGAGGVAVGISGKDGRLIEARKLQRTTKDPDSNIEKVLDLGFVGEPVRINPTLLQTFAQSDLIPVIAPIGVGEGGETYNINADTAAGKIAATLKASKLVMLTDIAGVLDGNGDLISKMTPEQADRLTQEGVIKGGMIPKLETCLDAVAEGVGAAHILDGRLPHVLLLEAFTTAGVGTMIEGGR